MGASGKSHLSHREFQGSFAGLIQGTQRAYRGGRDHGVNKTTGFLSLPRAQHPLPHGGRGNAGVLGAKLLKWHGGHFDMQIDPVQQRTADLAEVALDDPAGAAALAAGVAVVAARASMRMTVGRSRFDTRRGGKSIAARPASPSTMRRGKIPQARLSHEVQV